MKYRKCPSRDHIGDRNTPVSDFGPRQRQSYCRPCMAAAHRRYYANMAKNNPERKLWNSARGRSKRANIEFNISVKDIFVPKECPVLGIPLYHTSGKRTDNTPSIDRIISSKGYVIGNIHVISWKANKLKFDGSPEDHRKLYEYFREGGILDSIARYGHIRYDDGGRGVNAKGKLMRYG